jgi:cation:H+ antiporter
MDGILFLFLALLTIISSIKVAYYANAMDQKTKVSGSFIGGILLAGVTSLPELVTCLTATFINNPYMAIGDIIGSNIFNLFVLAFFDIIFIKKMIFNKISHRYLYINALLVYLYVILINSIINKGQNIIFNIGMPTIVIIIFYIIYILFLGKINNDHTDTEKVTEVKNVKLKFIFTAIFMVIVSIGLTLIADKLTLEYPAFSSSSIGAFLVGVTTSLPEVVSIYALIRMNSYNLAFANIIGSNMFNLLILALSDILYRNGSIYLFSDNETLSITKITLYISILVFVYIIRRKSFSKITYIIPSIIIVLAYIYLFNTIVMG